MSAVEQWPDGSPFDGQRGEPPPVVFSQDAAKAARPVVPRASVDRKPLSHAASRRRTSWMRRLGVLIVLLVAIAGVAIAIKDSKITIHGKHAAPHASTFLSAQQLGLAHHRHHHRAGK